MVREIASGTVRESQAEHFHCLSRERPVREILHPALALSGSQQFVIIGCRLFIDGQQILPVLFPLFGLFAVIGRRQRDLCTVCQILHGFLKGAVIIFHQKSDRASACTAPEAVEHVLAGNHTEGRCLFVVKRTKPDIVLSLLFQMYMGGDNVHDICIREDFVHNLLRIIHLIIYPFP